MRRVLIATACCLAFAILAGLRRGPPCRVVAVDPPGFGPGTSDCGEGTRLARCDNGDRYLLSRQLPCSETLLCRWVDAYCWDAERLSRP